MTLDDLHALGQSVWLDSIRRGLFTGGEIDVRIAEGTRGLTSNPTIFANAIAGSRDYDDALAALERGHEASPAEIYEALAIDDIQRAADAFRRVYDESERRDGYVSFEVSPHLAHDADATHAEATRLWARVGRENLMIKVPATPECIPVITRLLADAISVNVTLLFGREAYAQVAAAFLAGLEALAARGGDVSRVASVASVFVSRIDTAIARVIADRLPTATTAHADALCALEDRVAIANAKLAYRDFQHVVASPRFRALAARGAMPQRLLWASTSTKSPRSSDVLYVEALIGEDTVTTLPPGTLEAFVDHGRAERTLTRDVDDAEARLQSLDALGISLQEITDQLLVDGVRAFRRSYDELMIVVAAKRGHTVTSPIERTAARLPPAASHAVSAMLQRWTDERVPQRVWRHDPSVWTGRDEARWLAWLHLPKHVRPLAVDARHLARTVEAEGFTRAVLLGMGGSSSFPEVLARTFHPAVGALSISVLDTTDPVQITECAASLDLARTVFVVASKSGATLEPVLLESFFRPRVAARLGARNVARAFVAITDPGTPLDERARRGEHRAVFHGEPGVGGRYSALSAFGMVPAALMGLDPVALLARAERMALACAECVPPRESPGALLGAILGASAASGRDKVTLVVSPSIAAFGAWLEQLLAESTGKSGRGIVPVHGEPLGRPAAYGDDRLFVYLRLVTAIDGGQELAIEALERAGQPVVTITLETRDDLVQEAFRWELATALAGAALGIDPFDQPDVESSKVEARTLTERYEREHALAAETAFFVEDGISLFADDANRHAIEAARSGPPSTVAYLRAHLSRATAGDYVALLAWLDRSRAHEARLTAVRGLVRDRLRVATCLGFGPRFLHSTGQVYKGGPPTGVFVAITARAPTSLAIPGRQADFGVVLEAQARGDLAVLAARGRRVLRVHLEDRTRGLARLQEAIGEALR